MVEIYRQGDLLIIKRNSIPKTANKSESDIILEGEISGHAHRIVNGSIFDIWGQKYIEANEGATIVHEEHGPIELEPGTYQVIRQREFVDPSERPRVITHRDYRNVSD